MSLPPIGLQTMVLKKQYSIEDESVLDHVAGCGYVAVETGPQDPEGFKRKLDARGMKHGGLHVTPKSLDNVEPIVSKLAILDSHDVCNSGPIDWNQRGVDDYHRLAALLNHAGRALRNDGIHLHYHNHDIEFEPLPGDTCGFDILLAELDFDAVDFCIDVAWVAKADRDPASLLREHKDRVGYLHFKDYDDRGWTELGSGVVDLASVMEALPSLDKVRWVMIEQDSTKIDPLQSVALSRKYLSDTFGY